MITINIMLMFKIISLINLGIIIFLYMVGTFTDKNFNFFNTLITSLILLIPFIYIILN